VRTTSTPDLAGRLRLAIARTARRLRQEAGSELSPSLTAALSTIERHGPMTPSELAARERIQRPTVTRLLDRLATAGLVTRTPDPADGRSSLVAATPAGRELIEAMRTRKTAYLARRLETLDADERATLERAAQILEKVLRADFERPDAARRSQDAGPEAPRR
jgi:DNA-binding MarR family transcriptional regulator